MGKRSPRDGIPTKLQTGFQFLTKDFLRFWMVDIRLESRSYRPAPQNRHKVQGLVCAETEAGTAEGIRCTPPGESALFRLLAA